MKPSGHISHQSKAVRVGNRKLVETMEVYGGSFVEGIVATDNLEILLSRRSLSSHSIAIGAVP